MKLKILYIVLLSFILIAIPTSTGSSPVITKPFQQPNLFAQSLETSNDVRLPTGDYGSSGTWAVFPTTVSSKWDKVDETSSDDDTTYLTLGTTAGYALFNFTAFAVPASAIVTKLEVTYILRDITVGVNNIRPALRIGGTNYLTTSAGSDPGTGYLSVTYSYVVNPRTSVAWTVADINGTGANPLQQFGVNSSDANPAFRITSVSARVSYTQLVDTLTPPIYAPMDDGIITLAELTTEASYDARDGAYTLTDWDREITQAGINHIDDKLLGDFVNAKSWELTDTYTQLYDLYAKAPVKEQVAQINANLVKLETKKATLTTALTTAKGTGDKDTIQQAANAVAAVDGKISEFSQSLQYAGQITDLESAIARAKNKFKMALKEQEFRADQLVTRTYVHSTYYMDFANKGTVLTQNYTFTNGSATVNVVDPIANDAIAVNDYIQTTGGTQWYKVTARSDATDTCTITPVFQQANTGAAAAYASHVAAQNGTTIAKAFVHLNEYTTDTTRTAGDILKVRANQTNVMAGRSVAFDENGTVIAYNEIRGCSVADDPFSDASDVQPVIDFGNTTNNGVSLGYNNYWRFFNLTVTNTNYSSYGLIHFGNSLGGIADTCTVFGNSNASGIGIGVSGASTATITNCVVYGNKSSNINVAAASQANVSGCTLNGGAATTDYGIYSLGATAVSNTTFGATTTHDVSSIYTGALPIFIRNCSLVDSVEVTTSAYGYGGGSTTSEDHDQAIGAQYAKYYSGTVTKSSTVVRVGGGSSSALLLPSSVVTIKYPLNIAYGSLNPDFAIWCPASPTTVTVWMRANTIWATYPTAAQLFIQADYWAGATALRSQSTASTQTLVDNREPAGAGTYTADAGTNTTTVVDAALAGTAYIGKYLYNSTRSAGAEITNYVDGTKTITLGSAIASQTTGDTYYILDWVAFTTTFTPGTAGFVYIKVNLGLYASGKGIYVDVKPVTS